CVLCILLHFTPSITTPFSSTHPASTDIYTLSLHDALPIFLRFNKYKNVINKIKQITRKLIFIKDTPSQPPCIQNTPAAVPPTLEDRKSTRLNSSHVSISYAVFCLKKKTYKKYCASQEFREI